jgi:Family of unknown function (DUF6152)
MTGRLRHLLQAALIITALVTPASAHHSAANYDLSKEVAVKGTVIEWIWQNPHCVLRFDVTDDSGAVRHWAVEVQNPTSMTNRGWSRRSFAAGDQVTVSLHPSREGQPVGLMTKVLLASGQTLIADPMGQADAAATPVTSK